ncbi:MAG: putative nucleotidyltransferase substrate binding domain-containing protein [Vicinamibacteraceae bacterium]
METSAIRYRVADFLKQHPPFTAMEEGDLVALAAGGRVRFFEPHEYILCQGEPRKVHVFVIQHGSVTLWDERGGAPQLRDVLGVGDLLGAEQFNGERSCLFTARAAGDVLLYGLSAPDFGAMLAKYPYARQYVSALGSVISDFQWTDGGGDRGRLFLHDVAPPLAIVSPAHTVTDTARTLALIGGAVAVTNADQQILGVVTPETLLGWVAAGAVNAAGPISALTLAPPPTLGPDASIADAVMAIGTSATGAVAMTTDGSVAGRVLSIVTPRDLAPVFGDEPASILQAIRRAPDVASLASLNQRARGAALQQLTSAAATDWVARFTQAVDFGVLSRVVALTDSDEPGACWCVCGASGRAESMTRRAPRVILMHAGSSDQATAAAAYRRVADGLAQCGYLPAAAAPSGEFDVASVSEWSRRYAAWIQQPVVEEMSKNRALFDVYPFHGAPSPWQQTRASIASAIDRDIIRVLAHDCLASLPPMTFYQDAVIEQGGEESRVFRLEHSALRPLVDLGRVFGMASRETTRTSTLERLAIARRLLPAHERVFRDAAETLRIVLWLQARVGIAQGTDGTELPLPLLSRQDRHMLKSGFPVIERLLALTSDPTWLATI